MTHTIQQTRARCGINPKPQSSRWFKVLWWGFFGFITVYVFWVQITTMLSDFDAMDRAAAEAVAPAPTLPARGGEDV